MISIIGAGKVGGDAALFSALKRLDDEILLLDIIKGRPQGEAMDINHTLAEQGIDVHVWGSNDFSDMRGSNITVISAGFGRKSGMIRLDLLNQNASIVRTISENIKKYADDSIIITATNPLDPMVDIAYKTSGFERKRIIGMGATLDLDRYIQFVHELTGFSRDSITGLVIGEHGENMLPLLRYTFVDSIPLLKLIPKDNDLIQSTRQTSMRVIATKGATIHGPGNAIASLIESITFDRKKLIPVSTYLKGEFGYSDVVIGVPCIIDKNGIKEIIELDLDDEEAHIFDMGIKSVKNAVDTI